MQLSLYSHQCSFYCFLQDWAFVLAWTWNQCLLWCSGTKAKEVPIILLAWLLYTNCPDADFGETSTTCIWTGLLCVSEILYEKYELTNPLSTVNQNSPMEWIMDLKVNETRQTSAARFNSSFVENGTAEACLKVKNRSSWGGKMAALVKFSGSKSSCQS